MTETSWNIGGLPCDTWPDQRRTLIHLGHWQQANGPRPEGMGADEIGRIDKDSEYARRAIAHWQEWEGIDADGVFGDISHSTMRQRFCGMPDFAPNYDNEEAVRINGTRPFPAPCRTPLRVRYRIPNLPGMDGTSSRAAMAAAMADVGANCGLQLAFSDAASNIDVTLAPFSSGTLAMAMLCTGSCNRVHTLRMDSSNRSWRAQLAQAVFVHELGHNLGYYHTRTRGQIMYPSTNGSPHTLQEEDVERLQAWYGPPGTPQPPRPSPPNPPPPPVGKLDVTIGDTVYRGVDSVSVVPHRGGTGTGGGGSWNIGGLG
jgi:hypothetical protein